MTQEPYTGLATTFDTAAARIRELIDARPSGTIRKHYLNLLQVARRLG
jgi:hypothetical protein